MAPSIQPFDSPDVADALRQAVESGVDITIGIYDHISPVLVELAEKSKIKLVYSRNLSQAIVAATGP